MASLALTEDRVFQGIDRLLRIDLPTGSDEPALNKHYERHVDVIDLLEALEILGRFVRDTQDMIGKPKYHKDGAEFDFVTELTEDMKSYFYGVKDFIPEETLRKNKTKYSKMFTFVIEPMIKLYQSSSHEEAIQQYQDLIARCNSFIANNENEVSQFDVMVVSKVLKDEYLAICARRATLEVVEGIMRLRRKKRKKRRAA